MTNRELDPHSEPDAAVDATGAAMGELPAGFAIGEYRIECLLGRGGMGAVYAARQPEIGAQVAIKVLAAELSRDPRLVRALRRRGARREQDPPPEHRRHLRLRAARRRPRTTS